MEFKKGTFIPIVIMIFALGITAGFYLGKKQIKSETVEIRNSAADADKKNIALQKLSLLKSYTDFILLPKEKIADPEKYADDMGEKVKEINDNEITSKFYATGETADKEQKILDFLDFLNSSVKNDLQ